MVFHFLRKPVPEGAPEEMPIIGPQVVAHLKTEGDACPEAAPVNGEAVATDQVPEPEGRREASADEPCP
jgi:hypothetical protein